MGNLRFKIDWASLIVGSKFTVLAFFTLYLRAIFQVQGRPGAYIRRGDLTEGFLRYPGFANTPNLAYFTPKLFR